MAMACICTYVRYSTYVVDACLSRPPAGGQWTWRNGRGRKTYRVAGGKGPRYLAVQHNTTCSEEKGGKGDIGERKGLPTSLAIKQNMPGLFIVSP